MPAAYWRLGESSGTIAGDASGHGLDATYLAGVTLAQPGALTDGDTAMSCNASLTGRATIPASVWTALGTGAFSVELWLNTNTLSLPQGHRMAWSSGDTTNYNYVSLIGDGAGRVFASVRLHTAQVSLDSGFAVTAGLWYHVVVTWSGDGTPIRIYVNGTLRASSANQAGPFDPGTNVGAIGGWSVAQDSQFSWSGALDDVALYATALSAAQIAEHYALGIGALTTVTRTLNELTATRGLGV